MTTQLTVRWSAAGRSNGTTDTSAVTEAWSAALAGRGIRTLSDGGDTAADVELTAHLESGTVSIPPVSIPPVSMPAVSISLRGNGAGLSVDGAGVDLGAGTAERLIGVRTEDTGDRRHATVSRTLDPAHPADLELLVNLIAWAAPGHDDRRTDSPNLGLVDDPRWQSLKAAATALRRLQQHDGSVSDAATHPEAAELVDQLNREITALATVFSHDADYLAALVNDFDRWRDGGFGVPDFLDSLMQFHPERHRVDGMPHLVVFPMYTQNGSTDRLVEAVLLEVIWPDFVAELEAGDYSNTLFVPVRFLDFTPGYDTNSAVLFPETVAMREVPKFSWGAIFADREAARFRRVAAAAAATTGLALPPEAVRLLTDQQLAEETFVMWDLIHDRTHMRGDLPFDPFMIKQRMPFFLYSLEELRCDLTAFREAVRLEGSGLVHARLVQYAIVFDRIFRFAITGPRVRNYDGLGGQLLFAWLHQHRVLHWTDNRLSVEWEHVTAAVLELSHAIEDLYWRSIDRPKVAHWLAAYRLVADTVTPHPVSTWNRGVDALPLDGPPKGLTDLVHPDEFPLSMFYEALSRKLAGVIDGTRGITGVAADTTQTLDVGATGQRDPGAVEQSAA